MPKYRGFETGKELCGASAWRLKNALHFSSKSEESQFLIA